MLKFIAKSQQKRTFKVLANGEFSSEQEMQNGLCQGSVLSVTLFLVAINSIVECVQEGVTCLVYADDVVLMTDGVSAAEMEVKLQHSLDCIEKWQKKTGFRISAEKSASMTFRARSKRKPNSPSLRINDRLIPNEKNYKCLGVTLDSSLSYTKHIEEVRASCQQRLTFLRCVANQSWGGDRQTLTKLYKACIMEKMLYAAPLLYGVNQNKWKSLENVHSKGLRTISGAFYTSPILSVRAECGIHSLKEYVEQRTATYSAKIGAQSDEATVDVDEVLYTSEDSSTLSSNQNSSGELWNATQQNNNRTIQQTGTEIIRNLRINLPQLHIFITATIEPWYRLSFMTDKTLLEAVNEKISAQALKRIFAHRKASQYCIHRAIYTDGSRQAGKSGYAVVSEDVEIRKRINDVGGIFAAESAAVKEALSWVANQRGAGAFLICTDSLSVITTLEKHRINSKWMNDMTSMHNECIRQGKEVVLMWVPSHIGIPGNERADRSAKAALEGQIEPGVDVDYRQIKQVINKQIMQRWQTEWRQVRGNKLREVKDSVYPYKHAAKTRKENVVLTRLRIGHTLITHQYLLERKEQPRCARCNQFLTVKHIISNCPGLDTERDTYNIPTSMLEALGDNNDSIQRIINFVKELQIFNKI